MGRAAPRRAESGSGEAEARSRHGTAPSAPDHGGRAARRARAQRGRRALRYHARYAAARTRLVARAGPRQRRTSARRARTHLLRP